MKPKSRENIGGRVYVASDGLKIKVGMSTRGKCLGRFSELKRQFDFYVKDSFITDRRFDYRIIEKMTHEKLSRFHLNHEFFSASFAEGIKAVKEVMQELDALGFGGGVTQIK
ncbi:T5orf172 domain [Yersinia massiliensis]|uniref:GIY-YIG nuclease family protein n=1 Tax=Yersinia massiliensis TaxID=419257 RepID=UPI0005E0A580|nr:GIY-YIG nuclease family protein [Yersinia massiliensis]CNI67787.1 T5orf172 domain [Yersinia massiliensis]